MLWTVIIFYFPYTVWKAIYIFKEITLETSLIALRLQQQLVELPQLGSATDCRRRRTADSLIRVLVVPCRVGRARLPPSAPAPDRRWRPSDPRERLELDDVAHQRVGRVGELERQHRRIGEPQQQRARDLRQRAAVDEVAVGELRVPVHRVVHRVIDAAVALAAEADVERRQRQVLQERREVGSRAERLQPQRGSFSRCGSLGLRRVHHLAAARFFDHRLAGARIDHVTRDLVHQLLQPVRAAGAQPAFAGAVGVDVDSGLVAAARRRASRPTPSSRAAPTPRRPTTRG